MKFFLKLKNAQYHFTSYLDPLFPLELLVAPLPFFDSSSSSSSSSPLRITLFCVGGGGGGIWSVEFSLRKTFLLAEGGDGGPTLVTSESNKIISVFSVAYCYY